MKILLLDDHPLFRKGIAQTLLDAGVAQEVAEANTAAQALALLGGQPDFDCLFLDLDLPDMSGVDLLAELQARRIPVPAIILSANESAAVVNHCLHAGACGYLTKAAAADEILEALRALERAERYLARALRQPLSQFRDEQAEKAALPVPCLTRRQHQVLERLARGESNHHIAAALNISESTVKGHVSTLLALLGADNRTQCVNNARQLALLGRG